MTEASKTIFFVMLEGPYRSDATTTLLRLVDAALVQHHQVRVWACGGATLLTQRTLGAEKPRNFLDLDATYPSTAGLIAALLDHTTPLLRWYICRHCMEERGATAQIAQVKIQPPFRFFEHLRAADASLVMGPL